MKTFANFNEGDPQKVALVCYTSKLAVYTKVQNDYEYL